MQSLGSWSREKGKKTWQNGYYILRKSKSYKSNVIRGETSVEDHFLIHQSWLDIGICVHRN